MTRGLLAALLALAVPAAAGDAPPSPPAPAGGTEDAPSPPRVKEEVTVTATPILGGVRVDALAGTIGTVGVAFIGIAMGLGIPLGLAAGAVVCGAYFGDKMSPFSDIPNLAAVTAGADLFDHIKHTLKSAVPGWILSLAVYFFLGLRYSGAAVSSDSAGSSVSS